MQRLWILVLAAGCGNGLNLITPDLGGPGGPTGPTGPAPGAVGAPCISDSQCSFGVCLSIGRCSHTCPLPACDFGWVCAPEGARQVCQCPTVGVEMCNGIDDDCNGLVDDNAVCPGGGTCIKGSCTCTAPTGSNQLKLVAQSITVPQNRMQFGVDLNGDGKADNQYGNIIGALAANNLDVQGGVDMQVMSGQVLLLIDERSSDLTFTDDLCAGAVVTSAQAKANPDFSGNGSFTIDPTVMAGNFAGPITTSTFLSAAPATATTPVSLEVYLPLFSFGGNPPPSKLKLTAAQLRYNRATKSGQINGVIKKEDLAVAEAGVAATLNAQVQANPNSTSSKQTLQIFDVGGSADPTGKCGMTCQNPDGSCAVKGDGVISVCEVTSNSIIENILNPDLDMFDAAGNYAPNPANTNKDSLSIGFGFSAVGANF